MGTFKQGLDYFPFEIGLINDRKLRRPKLKFGYVATVIYLSLLELIYEDKGYYLLYNEQTKDDIIWEILENLQGKFQPDARTVEQVIEELVACELFSGDHFKSEILTSKRIQRVYYSATVERQTVDVNFEIWLLSESEMRQLSQKSSILKKFLNQSIDTANRPIDTGNRPIDMQSKEQESKVKKRESRSPALEEIRAYCQKRNNSVDPQRFYDYYSANGWKVGGQPICDWQAMIRRWESNGYDTAQLGRYSAEELDALVTDISED